MLASFCLLLFRLLVLPVPSFCFCGFLPFVAFVFVCVYVCLAVCLIASPLAIGSQSEAPVSLAAQGYQEGGLFVLLLWMESYYPVLCFFVFFVLFNVLCFFDRLGCWLIC